MVIVLRNADDPPLERTSKEVPQVSGCGYSDSLLFKSYVLCRRNPMGSGRLAVLALHGDNSLLD